MSKSGEFHHHMQSKGLLGKEGTKEYDLEASQFVLDLWSEHYHMCGCNKCHVMLKNAEALYTEARRNEMA